MLCHWTRSVSSLSLSVSHARVGSPTLLREAPFDDHESVRGEGRGDDHESLRREGPLDMRALVLMLLRLLGDVLEGFGDSFGFGLWCHLDAPCCKGVQIWKALEGHAVLPG